MHMRLPLWRASIMASIMPPCMEGPWGLSAQLRLMLIWLWIPQGQLGTIKIPAPPPEKHFTDQFSAATRWSLSSNNFNKIHCIIVKFDMWLQRITVEPHVKFHNDPLTHYWNILYYAHIFCDFPSSNTASARHQTRANEMLLSSGRPTNGFLPWDGRLLNSPWPGSWGLPMGYET